MPDNPFNAAGSATGYLYQVRYGLYYLLGRLPTVPDAELTLETIDDIAFETNGTATERIQTKHHVAQTGNLSDASVDLWKTIRVWAEQYAAGSLRLPQTTLILVTNALAPTDSAASLLRVTNRNESTALAKLNEVVRTSTSTTNIDSYKAFTRLSSSQKISLLAAIQVLDREPSITDLDTMIRRQLAFSVPRERTDYLVEHVEGWWFARSVECLADSAAHRSIRGTDLQGKIDDIRESLGRDSLPTDFCTGAPEALQDPITESRMFVKQLKIIGCNDLTISTAISDLYRSFRQRSDWVRRALLIDGELEQYDERLIDGWQREYAFMLEDIPIDSDDQQRQQSGRALYRKCQAKDIYIRPSCTNPVVMRGSLHDLADGKRVGWHPSFGDLLTDDGGATQ